MLCMHDDCLVDLLTQNHVFYLWKIYQLRGAIIKRYPSHFTNGFALASHDKRSCNTQAEFQAPQHQLFEVD